MNGWLGEPVPVSQLPGRGILRIYINNLVRKRLFVNKLLCILNIRGKTKKSAWYITRTFLFSHGKTKKSWWCFVYIKVDNLKSPGLFCIPMGKQKSPGGVPSGLFCFPKFIQTLNDLIFISWWVININTGKAFFLEVMESWNETLL